MSNEYIKNAVYNKDVVLLKTIIKTRDEYNTMLWYIDTMWQHPDDYNELLLPVIKHKVPHLVSIVIQRVICPHTIHNALVYCIKRHIDHWSYIRLLLKSSYTEPSYNSNELIRLAAEPYSAHILPYESTFNAIYIHPRFTLDATCISYNVLLHAVRYYYVDIIKVYVDMDPDDNAVEWYNTIIVMAAQYDRVSIVELLLQRSDLITSFNDTLIIAATYGHISIVNMLIPYIDKAQSLGNIINRCIIRRHFDVAALIITHTHAIIYDCEVNYLLYIVILHASNELINVIIDHYDGNTSINYHKHIHTTLMMDNKAAFDILINGGVDNLSIDDNKLLIQAIIVSNVYAVKSLISHNKVDLSINLCGIIEAIISSNISQAAMCALLYEGNIDPTISDNFALRCAVEHNNIEVVIILLRDGRCDPSVCSDIIDIVAQYGDYKLLYRLLNDDRITTFHVNTGNRAAIWKAVRNKALCV